MTQVSIGICTSGRNNYLSELLAQLATVQVPGLSARIVIIDNRPNTATADLCREAADRLPLPLHYVAEPEPGISFARNRMVAEVLAAGSRWLAFIDDDDLAEPDWLCHLLRRQAATGADIVMGNRRYLLPPSASDVARELLFERPLADDTPLWDECGLPFRQSTCNVLIAADVLRRVGAEGPVFDPEFALMGGGDLDFFCRARRSGSVFARAAASIVNQRVRAEHATFRGLLRRRFRHGLAQGILVRRYVVGEQRRQWHAAVRKRFLGACLRLPPRLLSSRRRAQEIIKFAWAAGCWYGYFGGRYRYYGAERRGAAQGGGARSGQESN